ncbi:DUF368 domain-containing protein [Aestuariicella hydrocarbonica]|uniref:DUF368 domain-containing protein n=2 Tax=Pseudomaricurvus hydrocarbonicus TaxID=1470433 RepID=A0A9E5T4N8_9GAMM|nr:DUF368 domain-containing protein [Aestuariicella hydrocarbonica]
MGAADVIPGVSGGTIAFITGIYTDLIDSLRSCDHKAVKCLLQEGIPSAWRHINGTFLLAVFGGILVSIFSLAKLMTYCLETQPILVWALFFGLILSSSLLLLQQVPGWNVRRVLLFVGGAAFVIGVSLIKPTQLPDEWWVVFSAGMIAICAMILPGISGGFLLLMMGLYSTIIGAVSSFNFAILIPLGIGCLIGLLLFSHVLSWLLHHFEAATMAFLTGVLIGSLKIIWPWKQTLETVIDRHGDTVPLVQANILPNHYTVMTGEPSQLVSAILMCLIGICLVGGMAFLASRRQKLN